MPYVPAPVIEKLYAMDALKKLEERNNKHATLVREENRFTQIVFVNYISLLVVTYYEVFKADSIFSIEPAISFICSLAFSVFLSSFGTDMIVRHWMRIILLTTCNAWFCYCWIWTNDTTGAFLPLAFIIIMWRKWFYWQWYKRLRNGI